MRVISFAFNRLLAPAQRFEVYYIKSLIDHQHHLLQYSDLSTKPSETPFNNPERPRDQTDVKRSGGPIQVQVSLENDENHSRVYFSNKPSVTTILQNTRPKNEQYALQKWKQGLINKVGETGYNDEVRKAITRGITFHQAVKEYLSTEGQPSLQESNLGHWESIQHILSNIDNIFALESVVIHPKLQYGGTLDGIISYQGQLCVIEWKTSQRKRKTLKDCVSYPVQIVAYAGAVNYDENYEPLQVNRGLLVFAYPDGSPADTIWLQPDDVESFWTQWLHRLELYHQTFSPFSNHGTKVRDLAQYMNGGTPGKPIPVPDYVESMMHDSGKTCSNVAEFSESIVIAPYELDPSITEYDDV